MKKSPDLYWPWYFFAAAFESLLAIIALLLIPSEGLSTARLGLFGILLLFMSAGIFLGFRAKSLNLTSLARPLFIYLAAVLAWTSGLVLFLLRYLDPEVLLPYYERLAPLLWLLLVLGVQSTFFLLIVRNGFHRDQAVTRLPVYRAALIAIAVLFLLFAFVAVTKIGVTPDTAYWGEPGPAILGWQLALTLLAGTVILLFGVSTSQGSSRRFTELLLPVGMYMLAAILWLSVPTSVLENSFYAPITPPANVPFPYSDAGFYDYLAQSLLIGGDYMGGIPPRPLYVTFLAALHFLFGQNYPAIIAVHTLVLAFFPVVLYFLGKKLHSPAAGTVVALIAIFREQVALWISSNTRVANSRIFTTDFPTALGIALLCLVVIWWLERRDMKSTLVAGGTFGLLMLFRTQSLFILPVIFVLAWLVVRPRLKTSLQAGALFILAMGTTVLPWLFHNYTISGKFSFDDPRQVAIIYSQYSFDGNLDLSQFDPEKDSVRERIISFTLENPGYVFRFIATHFLNTEIGGLLSLPLIKDFEGLTAPVNLYWVGWDGSLEWYNLLLVLFYLIVIGLGLGAAWQRMGWLGWAPLGFNLAYALANGISRFSSWRYNLPVDWVIYFYFALGIIELFYSASLLFGAKKTLALGRSQSEKARDFTLGRFHPSYVLILSGFVLVGAMPWLAKGITQPRYTSTPQQMVSQMASGNVSQGEIQAFLEQPNAVLAEGRLLYPRMYRRDEGMASATPWPAYAVREYARIGFVLINQNLQNAIFITRDLLDFPQGADATLLGCQREGYIEVRLIDFGERSFQSAPLTQPCE